MKLLLAIATCALLTGCGAPPRPDVAAHPTPAPVSKPVLPERAEATALEATAINLAIEARDAKVAAKAADQRAQVAEFKADHASLYALLTWVEWIGAILSIGGIALAVALRFEAIPFVSGKTAACLGVGGAVATALAIGIGDAAPHASEAVLVLTLVTGLVLFIADLRRHGVAYRFIASEWSKYSEEIRGRLPDISHALDQESLIAQVKVTGLRATVDEALAKV